MRILILPLNKKSHARSDLESSSWLPSIDFHSVTSVYQRSSYPHIFVSSKMNVSAAESLVFLDCPFSRSSLLERKQKKRAARRRGIFRRHVSMTRAASSAFRSLRVYHTSRNSFLLCPFLRVSAKHLVRTSFRASQSFALRSVKCTIRRYKDALMILTSSGTSSSPLEHESISRETLSSIKLLPVS